MNTGSLSSASAWAGAPAVTRNFNRRPARTVLPSGIGTPAAASAAGVSTYLASASSSGHSVTSWAVRYSQAVRSSRPVWLRSAVCLGTVWPATSAASFRSGCSCTTAIDGTGAR